MECLQASEEGLSLYVQAIKNAQDSNTQVTSVTGEYKNVCVPSEGVAEDSTSHYASQDEEKELKSKFTGDRVFTVHNKYNTARLYTTPLRRDTSITSSFRSRPSEV